MAGEMMGGVPVSAPGAMSSRTDRQPVMDIPSQSYGEAKEFREIQSGAPMAATPPPPRPSGLFSPTARPGEPVTSGVDYGDGPGSRAVGPNPTAYVPRTTMADTLSRLASVQPNDERIASLVRLTRMLGI